MADDIVVSIDDAPIDVLVEQNDIDVWIQEESIELSIWSDDITLEVAEDEIVVEVDGNTIENATIVNEKWRIWLATLRKIQPSFEASIVWWGVYRYEYNNATYYRMIPEPYNSLQDTFYWTFNAWVLSNPIATRAITL